MMSTLHDIRVAWEAFIHHRVLAPQIDTQVANSWLRCSPRLNPHRHLDPSRLSREQLTAARYANQGLLTVARPIMEDIHQYIEGSDTLILLINHAGYVLDTFGDPSMAEVSRRHGIDAGVSVSENHIGTNALSLPLYTGLPARTLGAEHYLAALHGLAMAAAPIFTLTGRVLGTLGLLTEAASYHPHSLGVVVAGARAIEGQLQATDLLEEQNVHLSELNTILASLSEGILVWNADRVVMHVNAAALQILGLSASVLVGRPISDYIRLPGFVQEALGAMKQLKEVEASLTVGDRKVHCVINLDHVQQNRERRLVIMTLRPVEAVRMLVQRQIGTRTLLTLEDLVGTSPAIQRVRQLVRAAAPATAPILIRGESGTGKNVLARVIHNESPRREGPFILVNCASVPSQFVLSDLLGYEGNALEGPPGGRPSKFELAQGGTLYFQDVEHLPLEAQAALLNAIELGMVVRLRSAHPIPVDVRIIASSSADLERLMAEGSFRADLYYRLSSFEVSLPPLRARREDLPALVRRILSRYQEQRQRRLELAPEALRVLEAYSWPGNLRELEGVLARAVIQAGDSEVIGPMHFPEAVRRPPPPPTGEALPSGVQPLRDLEREAILQAARACRGNLSQMARVLGISRTSVWRKMKALDLSPDRFRAGS